MFTKLLKSDEGFDWLLAVFGFLAIYLLAQIALVGQLLMLIGLLISIKQRKLKQGLFFTTFVIYPVFPMLSFGLGFVLFTMFIFGGSK